MLSKSDQKGIAEGGDTFCMHSYLGSQEKSDYWKFWVFHSFCG